jgi:hypothetical protein
MSKLKIKKVRNSYDMVFSAPLEAGLLKRYRDAVGESSFNELILITRNDVKTKNDEDLVHRTGRIHWDQATGMCR